MTRYSGIAITLHWLIAVLLIGNLAGGLLLDSLFDPDTGALGSMRGQIMGLHKSMGLTILMLSILRLGVRLSAGVPPLPGHMTSIEKLMARITHVGFYFLLIAIPMSGWAMSSASLKAPPTIWFGLFEWPRLPVVGNEAVGGFANDAHGLLAWGAVVLILLHIAGALKHHFWDRDDVLARMIPLLRSPGR